jgi:hypothetical protein
VTHVRVDALYVNTRLLTSSNSTKPGHCRFSEMKMGNPAAAPLPREKWASAVLRQWSEVYLCKM